MTEIAGAGLRDSPPDERGTEARHPPRPGEVSIPSGTTAETTLQLSQPGTYTFACHLPGHYAYGMHGTITVVA